MAVKSKKIMQKTKTSINAITHLILVTPCAIPTVKTPQRKN